jgi:hypothetical protein
MKNFWIAFSASILFLTGCKQKKKEETKEPFFPVISFLQSQVANIDTSLYSIRKINILDSAHSDTIYVKRDEFRGLAKEFLELPDLMSKKYKDRFTEEKQYDESMNTVIIRYIPKDPEKEEIQKEEVLIAPNIATGDQVKNIIIEKVISNKDGYLQKFFLWRVDKSFQITTTTQKPGEPEMTSTMKVSWNEKDEE